MSLNNEINFLSGERIWDETQKALSYKNSSKYFATIKKIGALKYFDGLEKTYSKNLKFLKKMDNETNMVLEKWAIINLNSNHAEILERKIRVPNKISNFRKTLNELFQLIKKKNINEKKLLTSLNKMNFFRNESNLIDSLDLLQKLKIISSKTNKNWKSLLKELKKVKVKTSDLRAEEIKEKIFNKRLKTIRDKKNDL
jgi:tRNA nucleotidyltransferase/poly(A) polymerase